MITTLWKLVVLFSVLLDLGFCDYEVYEGDYISGTSSTRAEDYFPNTRRASACLLDVTGDAITVLGQLTFTQSFDGGPVKINGTITGITDTNQHALHIHEYGDCSNIGNHYNPTNEEHGGINTPVRHLGDLGNITADATNTAFINIEVDYISLTNYNCGRSILGRSIVVHADPDTTVPGGDVGDSGSVLACGVIGLSPSYYVEYP